MVSLLVLASFSAIAQRYKSITLSRENFVDTVKVEISDGAVIVPVEINGVVRHLLFDTGAQTGFWVGEEEEWMTLMPEDSLKVCDSQNMKRKKALFKFPPMKMGNLTIEDYPMIVDNAMSEYSCGLFDGGLGFDLVAKGISFKLDTKDSLLIVTDRKRFFAREEKKQPFLKYMPYSDTKPMVWVQFPFARVKMLFDLGYVGGWFDLSLYHLNRWTADSPRMKQIVDELTVQVDTTITTQAGLFGNRKDTVESKRLHSPEIKLGELTFKDVWTTAGKKSVKMGSAFLEHVSLIIDTQKKRFVFLPHDGNNEFVVGNEGNGLSFIIADAGDTLGALRAVVRKNSKAYNAGLRTGDYLISINGIPIPDYCTYSDIIDYETVKQRVLRSPEGEEKVIDW